MVVCERDPDVTLTHAYGTRLLVQGLQIDELCLWILSEVPRQKGHTRFRLKSVSVLSKLLQSYPTLCSPTDCSPPGSSLPGILQARGLEWGAVPLVRAERLGLCPCNTTAI